MSLINDYLKKTEHNTKGSTQIGDLPPVLKTTGKSSGSRVYLRIISILLLILIAGAGYYLYTVPGKIKKEYGIEKQAAAKPAPAKQQRDKLKQERKILPEAIKPEIIKNEIEHEKKLVSLPIKEINKEGVESEVKRRSVQTEEKPEIKKPAVYISSVKKQNKIKQQTVNVNSYYQIAFFSQREGNYTEAERLYREVLKIKPGHIDSLTNLTVINIDRGIYEEAKKQIAKIRKYEPLNTKAYVNEGLINLKTGNTVAAIKAFETVLKIDKNEEIALTNLAYIASTENNLDLMGKCYKNSYPPGNEIALTYASMLERKSMYKDAVAIYAEVIENPDNKKNYQLMNRIKDRMQLISTY